MEKTIAAERAIEVYVVIAKEERRAHALAQMQQLRDRGYRVDYSFTAAKVARQFRLAEEGGAPLAILFGDEWPQVGVKNLETGEQRPVAHEELFAHLATFPTCHPERRVEESRRRGFGLCKGFLDFARNDGTDVPHPPL